MIKRLLGIGNPLTYTHREYEAAVNALNIFFGAVIGVSLGGAEDLPTGDYVLLLLGTAAMVTAILFVSYSHRRVWNCLWLAAVLVGYWYLTERGGFGFPVPDKLLPTLAVWAGMAVFTEFAPRAAEPGEDQEPA